MSSEEIRLEVDPNQAILVVRADRLGDVVLSTPVFEVIKRNYPKSKLVAMVQRPIVSVIAGLPSIDEVMVYDPRGSHAGLKGFLSLIKEIRAHKFRIAVVLHSQWKLSLAIYLAGVRYRVGPLSKFHSYLFYNRGLRQHRSQVEMHETDYNLQLLRKIGIRVSARSVPVRVHLDPSRRNEALEWLKSKGWSSNTPLIGVHPGMGGSALNWPESHYVELIRALTKDKRGVLVTGGPTEGMMLKRVQEALGEDSKKIIFYRGTTDTKSLDYLAGLYSWTSVVIAPSTGPLHLATALGKPVVTFYPPIRVQSAIRWGPYLSDDTHASVLVPDVYCGEDFSCRLHLCNYYPCMKSLTVSQALEETENHLKRGNLENEKNKST